MITHKTLGGSPMYYNGEKLTDDIHFQDHLEEFIPIQVYLEHQHSDIGFIKKFCSTYVKINETYYHRDAYVFISRPGY